MSDQAMVANAAARQLAGGLVDSESTGVAESEVVATPRSVPYVRLPFDGAIISETAREMGSLLKQQNLFCRDEQVVTIAERQGAGGIVPMPPQRFRTYVEDHLVPACLKGIDKNGQPIWRRQSLSADIAASVLQSAVFFRQLRPLVRVNQVPMPVMRTEGEAANRIELLQPGYDSQSKIFTRTSDVFVRPDMPIADAVAMIRDLFSEFPFGDRKPDGTSRSEAVCVASMVSLFGIGLLGTKATRLHFVMTANSVASGKSLLAKIPLVLVTGTARVALKGDNSEELRKALATAALDGETYLFLDDLDGVLKSQELNAFMTASTVSGRMMGGLTGFSVEKQCVVFITGNNLKLSEDIERRTLRVALYSEQFDAQERQVKRCIDEEWLSDPVRRGDLLSAFWALIREWDKAGRPKGARVLRGFERWCEVFGGIVIAAGFGDPCEAAPRDDNSGSNVIADMLALVESLMRRMYTVEDGREVRVDHKEFTFQEVVEECHECDAFMGFLDGTWKKDKETGEEWLELHQTSKSRFGRLLTEKGGQIMRLKSGERVRFGKRGRNRHRRYEIEIIKDDVSTARSA